MDRKHVMWAVSAALAVLAVAVILWGSTSSRNPAAELASDITIRYEDTGDEVKMNRGILEREVIARIHLKAPIDDSIGILNPKTGRQTGFPIDRKYWNQLIEQIKEASKARSLPK